LNGLGGTFSAQDVRLRGLLQDGCQTVFDCTPAIALAAYFLAGKATDTAFEIKVIEMHQLGFRTILGGARQGMLKQARGIPILPGTAINCNRSHVFSLLRMVHIRPDSQIGPTPYSLNIVVGLNSSTILGSTHGTEKIAR
jgi:hypothetical protein